MKPKILCIVLNTDNLSGVEFTLAENGDVLWSYSENFERLPLLDCDTYEVLRERDNFTVEVLLRFGAWKGNPDIGL